MVIHRTASLLVLCGLAACATTAPDTQATAAVAVPTAAVAPATDPAPTAAPEAPAPLLPAEIPPAPPAPVEPKAPVQVATKPKPAAPAPNPAKPRPAPPAPKPAKPAAAPDAEAAPSKAVANSVAGRLELVAGGREGIVAGEVAEGLVYFLPKGGGAAPKPGSYTVDTRSKGFSPSVLVVPVGSTVRFPNRDSILHNVFSRTPGSTFDFGFYGPGESKQRVFSKPGLVVVNCNVHHNMRVDVVVLSTPHYTRPDRNGRYSLAGLPKGPGTLVFWHPRANAQQVAVNLPLDAAVSRRLVASKPSRHAGMGH